MDSFSRRTLLLGSVLWAGAGALEAAWRIILTEYRTPTLTALAVFVCGATGIYAVAGLVIASLGVASTRVVSRLFHRSPLTSTTVTVTVTATLLALLHTRPPVRAWLGNIEQVEWLPLVLGAAALCGAGLGIALGRRVRPGLLTIAAGGAGILGAVASLAVASSDYSAARTTAAPAATAPNILLITIDTLRADHLGTFGYTRATSPVIDALAAQGVTFENAYAQTPLTNPSHASILTSRYACSHGSFMNYYRLDTTVSSVAEILRDAGYATSAVVSGYPLMASTSSLEQGFDLYSDDLKGAGKYYTLRLVDRLQRIDLLPPPPAGERRPAAEATDAALDWLGDHSSSALPYFLWVHYYDPHTPYAPPPPYDTMFTPLGVPDIDGEQFRRWQEGEEVIPPAEFERQIALYDGAIRYTDTEIGRLLEAVRAHQSTRSTYVVLTADHGESFEHNYLFAHGAQLWEPITHIPLVMQGPGLPGGRRIPDIVQSIDIAPTLLTWAGVLPGPQMEGRSLSPYFASTPPPPSDDVQAFSETGYPEVGLGETGSRTSRPNRVALREGPWKYMRSELRSVEHLYNLGPDPGETANLATPETPRADAMHQRIMDWQDSCLTRRAASPPDLDCEKIAHLCSLGYLGGDDCARLTAGCE